jgi:membrane protease YdiL (CAAX protease family)
VAYVAIVLVYDTFVTLGDVRTINWAVFAWRPAHLAELLQPFLGRGLTQWLHAPLLREFDLFKLTAWGVIPFLLCLWRLDTGWFGMGRWKRSDRTLLIACCVLAVAAVGLVRLVPQLAEIYPAAPRGWTFSKRLILFGGGLLWVASWLPAWEFLHRYFLLRRVSADFPKYGWLVVPLSETLYHLHKPPLETAGMLVFSLLATWWTLKRRNLLLPLLVHLVVEVALQVLLVV